MEKIAFIGLGNMGLPMATNLVKAGHSVQGFDVVPAANAAAAEAGITVAPSAVEAVKGADIAISMLPNGRLVLELYGSGILQAASPDTLFIDSSTIDVDSARAAHALALAAGMESLDGPVSGGIGGAAAGTLTFMAGGTEAAFARARPVLERDGQENCSLRWRRGGPGRENLQQHDSGRFDDRRGRSLCPGRKAWAFLPGLVRCRLHLIRPMLVANHLLPRAGPGARQPCE